MPCGLVVSIRNVSCPGTCCIFLPLKLGVSLVAMLCPGNKRTGGRRQGCSYLPARRIDASRLLGENILGTVPQQWLIVSSLIFHLTYLVSLVLLRATILPSSFPLSVSQILSLSLAFGRNDVDFQIFQTLNIFTNVLPQGLCGCDRVYAGNLHWRHSLSAQWQLRCNGSCTIHSFFWAWNACATICFVTLMPGDAMFWNDSAFRLAYASLCCVFFELWSVLRFLSQQGYSESFYHVPSLLGLAGIVLGDAVMLLWLRKCETAYQTVCQVSQDS